MRLIGRQKMRLLLEKSRISWFSYRRKTSHLRKTGYVHDDLHFKQPLQRESGPQKEIGKPFSPDYC